MNDTLAYLLTLLLQPVGRVWLPGPCHLCERRTLTKRVVQDCVAPLWLCGRCARRQR